MTASHLDEFSTEELVERFKQATLEGYPLQGLIEALARRPGIAFIHATDSSAVTLQKAHTAIEQAEQLNQWIKDFTQ